MKNMIKIRIEEIKNLEKLQAISPEERDVLIEYHERKNLYEKEIKLIKDAIRNQIESAEDCIYIEGKRNNERAIKRIEEYIKELEEVYKKL